MPSYKVKVHRKDDPFVRVPRETAQDENLPPKALGLLVHMLSYPDDWDYHVDHLKEQLPIGRGAIYSAMEILQDRGYLYKKQERGDDGRMKPVEYHFFDVPVSNPKEFIRSRSVPGDPGSGFSGSGKSVNGSTGSGESDTTKKTIDKDRSHKDQRDRKNLARETPPAKSVRDEFYWESKYGLEPLEKWKWTDPLMIDRFWREIARDPNGCIHSDPAMAETATQIGAYFEKDEIRHFMHEAKENVKEKEGRWSYFMACLKRKIRNRVEGEDDTDTTTNDNYLIDDFSEEAG